jgi:chaperonin GroES
MKLRPLHDRVIVKRLEEEKKTAGGIIIPDQAAEKPLKAEVVAVGPGKITDDGKLQAPDIKKGDHVLIGKYSGTEVRIEGEDLVVLREDDIMAVFTK